MICEHTPTGSEWQKERREVQMLSFALSSCSSWIQMWLESWFFCALRLTHFFIICLKHSHAFSHHCGAVLHWGQFIDQISADAGQSISSSCEGFLLISVSRVSGDENEIAHHSEHWIADRVCVRLYQLDTSWIKLLCFATYSLTKWKDEWQLPLQAAIIQLKISELSHFPSMDSSTLCRRIKTSYGRKSFDSKMGTSSKTCHL